MFVSGHYLPQRPIASSLTKIRERLVPNPPGANHSFFTFTSAMYGLEAVNRRGWADQTQIHLSYLQTG